MKNDILSFVAECDTCQRNKGKTIQIQGVLQPFIISPSLWIDISMEFIVVLPKASNKYVIMVVVDRLFKYAHFCSLKHPFTPATIA